MVTVSLTDQKLADYYAQRAETYERIYHKPERQEELAVLHERLPALLADRNVLEIACGTGYWTQYVARTASAVRAVDINEEVLAIARTKVMGPAPVVIEQGDLNAMQPGEPPPDGALAAFWWSHVERQALPAFLAQFHAQLAADAVVVFLDNRYVEGSSTAVARTDADGNTYQHRPLDDGSMHEVLKNFPGEAELRALFAPYSSQCAVVMLEYYWYATYRLGA